MSLVDADTGEVLAEMTPESARDLTDRIKTVVGAAWELVKQAYESRAWAALGYSSWDAYCSAEFGASRLKLPREERQEVVHSLREAGLSIRAIAATGIAARSTVEADLAGVPNRDTSSEPTQETDDDMDVMDRLHQAAAEEKKVTGTDGKTYPATDATRDRVVRAKLLASDGKTVKQIAEALGMEHKHCGNFLRDHGVEVTAGNTSAAIAARVAKAREMAASGHTSRQIAEALGYTFESFREFCRDRDIEVPADAHIGKTRKHDHDRIIRESVSTLEGVVMGLDLVGDPRDAALDPNQINDWATSLSDSLRLLNRFSKQLKEMTQ